MSEAIGPRASTILRAAALAAAGLTLAALVAHAGPGSDLARAEAQTDLTRAGSELDLAYSGSPADVARDQEQERRGGFVGPAEGETLGEWTARWMEGPVQVIATEEERELYEELESTQERLEFIRLFWERRDPVIRGRENEYLEEFRQRVEYAEAEFGDGQPGWDTVFGRVALVLGIPDRTRRELGLPPDLSDRPPIIWGYDGRIPEWPTNEDLLFVFQRGRWRLYPPSPVSDSGVAQQQRAIERSNLVSEFPSDFDRVAEAKVEEALVQPVDYGQIVRGVQAAVAFPESEIPFGWQASFGPGEGDARAVELRLSWRMESLIFHEVDGRFQTEMLVRATLFGDDGEPVARTTETINVEVPAADLQARGGEIVERTVTLEAEPGTYDLELVLEDQLLGYRTTYRDALEVPGGVPASS